MFSMERNDVIEEGAKVEEFKPLPFWRELFLKKEELQEYYIKKREYQYNMDLNRLLCHNPY